MDPQHLHKLRTQQEAAVQETRSKIEQWMKFKSDYESLKARLLSLPDQLNYDVMVPFGSKAFMPGQITHTNEILVLLGDNWFVERSAKQAAEIIQRRLKGINDNLADLEKQKRLLEPRVGFTSELEDITNEKGDVVEIREDYDAEKEKEWRAVHRKRVAEQRRKLKVEKSSDGSEEPKEQPCHTDEEVWARLDQLERQELKGRELTSTKDPDPMTIARQKYNDILHARKPSSDNNDDDEDTKKVKWKDGDEEIERVTRQIQNTITFKHTKHTPKPSSGHKLHLDGTGDASSPQSSHDAPLHLTSPADVYKYFCPIEPHQPRSILKSGTSQQETFNGNDHMRIQEADIPPPPVIPATAFSGTVMETDTIGPTPHDVTDTQPRRISKFKARRQNQS